jgi:ubiquinol-cytochrome c reductase cytochrome c1 subunit
MMGRFKEIFAVACFLIATGTTYASSGHEVVALEKVNTDVLDTTSLQRGGKLFAEYCMGCHSMKYMRVSRAAKDLGWSPSEGLTHLQYLRGGKAKVHDPMMSTIDAQSAKLAFGSIPPDLSLEARLKGADWVYSFLKAYQRDANGQVSNAVFSGVAMPFVLEGLKNGQTPEAYEASLRDLVNFLDYAAEPAKVKRLMLGWWVLGFLAVLFMLTYLLKKEFWRDIKSA